MLLLNQLSPNNYPEITSWMTHAPVSRIKQTSSVLHVQIMQIVGCTTQLIFLEQRHSPSFIESVTNTNNPGTGVTSFTV